MQSTDAPIRDRAYTANGGPIDIAAFVAANGCTDEEQLAIGDLETGAALTVYLPSTDERVTISRVA